MILKTSLDIQLFKQTQSILPGKIKNNNIVTFILLDRYTPILSHNHIKQLNYTQKCSLYSFESVLIERKNVMLVL